jgi:hypothetical protein
MFDERREAALGAAGVLICLTEAPPMARLLPPVRSFSRGHKCPCRDPVGLGGLEEGEFEGDSPTEK